MAVQTRTIKRRIKSVKNTKKITKAMELVAASKMRKAVNSVLSTRPYATLAWETVRMIGAKTEGITHPLLRQSEQVSKVLIVLVTSDRGLAGGFNTNIIRKTLDYISKLPEGVEVEALCIGRRGAEAMRKRNIPVIASFQDLTNNLSHEDILPIGRMIIEEFTKEIYDEVYVAYTDFKSAISQEAKVLELLPLREPEAPADLGEVGEEKGSQDLGPAGPQGSEYTFEPSPQAVLDHMLPRLVETMVYQAVLESAASEHSARMMAMRSATDAAGDMIEELTFIFNQARQASITQEIAEISSGKAALEG